MKKRVLTMAVVLLAVAGGAWAQKTEYGLLNHWGVGVGVGTTGVTVDVATCVTPYLGVRGGLDILPEVKYSTDLDLDIPSEAMTTYNQLRTLATAVYPAAASWPATLPTEVEVEGKPKLGGGHVLLDVYPFPKASSFRVTVGAYFGKDKIATVYNNNCQEVLKVIHDYNGLESVAQGLDLPFEKIGVELGDYFLEPDKDGNVEASIKVKSLRPYVGLGFGRAVPKKRIGCQFDLGVQMWGKPEVYAQDHKLTSRDLDGDGGEVLKYISKVSVWPVLTFRLVGRIL